MPSLLVFDAPVVGWAHIAVVHQNRELVLDVNGAQARRRLLFARFFVTFGEICLRKDGLKRPQPFAPGKRELCQDDLSLMLMKRALAGNCLLGVIALALTMFPAGLGRGQQIAPAIGSVTGIGSRVEVLFTVPVEAMSAVNLTNYALSNWYGNVSVVGAKFGTNSQTVELTTAAQLPFLPHWLTVNGVADTLTGNQPHRARLPRHIHQYRLHHRLHRI